MGIARRLSLVVLLFSPLGCSSGEYHEAVFQALEQTVVALGEGDWKTAWLYSAPQAREELLTLHGELHAALEAVETVYPEQSREQARAAVGRDLVADIPVGAPDAGPRLLGRLMAPGAIRFDDKARDGLRARGAIVDGDQAEIETAAGEVFRFQRTEAGWQARLIMDILDGSDEVKALRGNARAVQEAAASHHAVWKESTDPATPHGAYNAVRAALDADPPRGEVVFAGIDAEARAVVLEALRLSRKAQKSIQRRVTRIERARAYAKHGVTPYRASWKDQELYLYWMTRDDYVAPLTDKTAPVSVEPGETEAKRIVVTESGARIPLALGADSLWHLEGHKAAAEKGLLAPMQVLMEKLQPPGGR